MRLIHRLSFVALALAPAASLSAQTPPAAAPADRPYLSSADIQAMIAAAKKQGTTVLNQQVVQLSPYRANLEVRPAEGPAAVHEKEAEFFAVLDGAGTLVTGGTLIGEKRMNAANLTGTGITNGTPRKVAKGDVFIVPENTAHQFTAITAPLVLVSLHLPR